MRAAARQAAAEAAPLVTPAPAMPATATAETTVQTAPLLTTLTATPLSPAPTLAATVAKGLNAGTAGSDPEVASTSCKALPVPPTSVKCWNCDHEMALGHQCEELPPVSSCNLTGQTEASLLGKNVAHSGSDSDICI